MHCHVTICVLLGVIAGVFCTPVTNTTDDSEEAGPGGQRIFGGEGADVREFPYQISMRWTYGSPRPMHFCGGSIIDESHIVTAAHCVDDKRSPDLLRYIRVYTGTSRSDGHGGNVRAVKAVVIHPGYRGAANTYLNDIAIVTLSEPLQFDDVQKPIKLPTRNIQTGASAVVTGWGNTSRGSQTPLQLQKAQMRLVPSSQCQYQLPYPLKGSQLCAIQRRGVGVCSGDSGGPLVANGELVGIASYVVECGKGHPDVYTNVYAFVDFIKQSTAYFV